MIVSKKLIATVLCQTVLFQTMIASAQTGAGSAQVGLETYSLESTKDRAEIIRAELSQLKANVDSGKMSAQDAVGALSEAFVKNKISLADIEQFVRLNSTEAEYQEFQRVVNASLKNVNAAQLSNEELGSVLAQAMASTSSQGLSWSGCAGAAIGVILIIGAIVVGIIALVKTEGVGRIQNRYNNKRNDRQDQYLRDKQNVTNRVQDIDRQITDNNGKINQNQQDVNYKLGQISASSDPEQIKALADQIKSINDNTVSLQRANADLGIERTNYSNPVYVSNKLAQIDSQYTADVAQLNSEEKRAVDLVPANQALAGKLGIAAGVAGAVGIYFAIDGFSDCN